MWKERLWQVFLIAILGLTLTMCSRSGGNNNPPVANAGLSEISHTMMCIYATSNSGIITYSGCDASDDTVLTTIDSQLASITHDDASAAGWKIVGPGCSTGNTQYRWCVVFHK